MASHIRDELCKHGINTKYISFFLTFSRKTISNEEIKGIDLLTYIVEYFSLMKKDDFEFLRAKIFKTTV